MKLMKRALALLLCFLMLTNGPISAFATEGTDDVVVETTTTTETVETCEECGGSDAHTDTCSLNIVAPLTTETPDETTEPTTTPTKTTEPTTAPTLATGPAISTDPVGCTECNQTEGHLDTCSQYVAPTEETTEPTVSGNDAVGCTECGATEGHTTECSQYAAHVEINVFADLMAAESVEAMYAQILDIVNGDDAERREALMNLTYDELEELRTHVNELDPEGNDADTADMLDMLSALPNAECPDCGLIGEHEEDCPRWQAEVLLPSDDYIYFDLYYGDVTITDTNYSGYVGNGTAGGKKPVTGLHNANNKYYIFQSNGEAYAEIPRYSRLEYEGKSWGEYITNNTDVEGVIEAWDIAARAVGRAETPAEMKLNDNVVASNPDVTVMQHHRIIIESAEATKTNFDVTIDNIWSGFQNDDCRDTAGNFYTGTNINDGPHYRTSGGLTFRPNNKETTATIRLKGDNRFGNVHYEAGSGAGGSTDSAEIDSRIRQMFFCNADEISNPGTMTVGNLRGDVGENHFDSVIGGANNPNYVPGLVFQGGTIYAGATVLDNCTAIGGGGCGFGGVTIEGGTITAVTATNGAAIGGGIGDGSNGGATDILISGGTVYAYNKGLAIEGTRESRGEAGTTAGETVYVVMPAVAIGSGSSRRQWTVPAKIEITGGTVYAQSVGGTAIGAGSSNNFDAADADIKIGGNAVVTAKSVSGTVTAIHEYDQGAFPTYVGKTETVNASNAIGGGTAGIPFRYETSSLLYAQGNGGDCVLTISDNAKIYAGSIGGGGVSDIRNSDDTAPRPDTVGKIGSAQVTISGGTTQGQVIMAKGAEMDCFFKMSGGTIDNSTKDDTFVFLKENGGAVYVENGNATMTGGTIKNCDDAIDGGVFYVVGGNVKISGNSLIESNEARNGGVAYVSEGNFTMSGGTITENTAVNGAGVYVTDGEFDMISGSLVNNVASSHGGGAYVHGGNITIGVENCKAAGENHDGMYTNLTHPVVEKNDASFGGGLAADGGTINIYCGQVISNTADNAGMGDNVFMYDQNTGDNEKPVLNHINGQVGEDENHGMVVIGGEMNIPYEEGQLKITINYHDNGKELQFKVWVGHAPDEYYLNLPYCPQEWETTQSGKGLTFVGWTYDTKTTTPPVQDNVDLSFIRDKEDYEALGDPVRIHKVDWKVKDGGYYIDFYAVWAPLENNVTYDIDLENYGTVPNELGKAMTSDQQNGNTTSYTFSQTVPATITMTNPEIAGYTFKGWRITPSKDKISNWSVVSNATDETVFYADGSTSGTGALAGYGYEYKDGQFILTTDRNFGDIKLTAVFEEQTAEYTYILVGPEKATDFGTLTAKGASENYLPVTENKQYTVTIGKVTGNPGTATAKAEYGFKLKAPDGWFTYEAGTTAVTSNVATVTEGTLTPVRVNNLYEGGTFYAVIEYHLADLIITKTATGSHSGNQTFIFEVYQGNKLLTTVALQAGESVTIKDLTIGTIYTVKEVGGWSWRFDVQNDEHMMVPVAEGAENTNKVNFANTQQKDLWLTDDDFVLNKRSNKKGGKTDV